MADALRSLGHHPVRLHPGFDMKSECQLCKERDGTDSTWCRYALTYWITRPVRTPVPGSPGMNELHSMGIKKDHEGGVPFGRPAAACWKHSNSWMRGGNDLPYRRNAALSRYSRSSSRTWALMRSCSDICRRHSRCARTQSRMPGRRGQTHHVVDGQGLSREIQKAMT